jgi:hypothetical protein
MLRLSTVFKAVANQTRAEVWRLYSNGSKPTLSALLSQRDLKAHNEKTKQQLLEKQRVRADKKRREDLEREKKRKESERMRAHKAKLRKMKQEAIEQEKRRQDREKAVLARQKLRDALKAKQKKEAAKNQPKKRAVDPDAPKRSSTAFVWFLTQNYNRIATANNIAGKEVMKKASEEFKALNDADKQYYTNLAGEDNARYQKERKSYDQRRAAKKPVRPLTPYVRYFVEVRPSIVQENPSLKVTEVSKLIGEKWRALSDSEKNKYIEAYNADKQK